MRLGGVVGPSVPATGVENRGHTQESFDREKRSGEEGLARQAVSPSAATSSCLAEDRQIEKVTAEPPCPHSLRELKKLPWITHGLPSGFHLLRNLRGRSDGPQP